MSSKISWLTKQSRRLCVAIIVFSHYSAVAKEAIQDSFEVEPDPKIFVQPPPLSQNSNGGLQTKKPPAKPPKPMESVEETLETPNGYGGGMGWPSYQGFGSGQLPSAPFMNGISAPGFYMGYNTNFNFPPPSANFSAYDDLVAQKKNTRAENSENSEEPSVDRRLGLGGALIAVEWLKKNLPESQYKCAMDTYLDAIGLGNYSDVSDVGSGNAGLARHFKRTVATNPCFSEIAKQFYCKRPMTLL